jgi:hypothetical protein
MSGFSSVLELAQTVTEEANRINEGTKAEQDADRVLNRVNETIPILGRLTQVLSAVNGLSAASGAQAVDLSGLDDGRKAFERLASNAGWLPSDRAFNDAKNKMNEVIKRVTTGLADAWTRWAGQEVAEVPSLRISLLEQEHQRTVRERWANLVKISKVEAPTRDQINSFKSDLGILHEILDPLPDPPGAVLGILDRLGQRPVLTLADLADGQIAVLREAGVADQIEVRRRGA